MRLLPLEWDKDPTWHTGESDSFYKLCKQHGVARPSRTITTNGERIYCWKFIPTFKNAPYIIPVRITAKRFGFFGAFEPSKLEFFFPATIEETSSVEFRSDDEQDWNFLRTMIDFYLNTD